MKMTQFDMTRGTATAKINLLTRNMETDEIKGGEAKWSDFQPTIIEEWNEEESEVRMMLPALYGTGKRGSMVFYGSFAIMEWDADEGDFADPASLDAIPEALGGNGLYRSYRENKAANKGRRRL